MDLTQTLRLVAWLEAEGAAVQRFDVPADEHGAPLAGTGPALAAQLGAVGVKALLTRGDDEVFRILAIPARGELDSAAARGALGLRKLRFARAEELAALTGVLPGGVPPFGRPHFAVDLVADASLATAPRIVFGGGHPLVRLSVAGDDWRRLAQPRFERLAAG